MKDAIVNYLKFKKCPLKSFPLLACRWASEKKGSRLCPEAAPVSQSIHTTGFSGAGGGGQLSQRCFDLFDDVQRSPGRSALTSLKWHLGSIDSLLQGGISMGENMLSNP